MKEQQDQLLWIGEEDLTSDPQWRKEVQSEFSSTSLADQLAEEGNGDAFATNRRDFLKYLGFGLGAATVAASCEIPVKKALPYVIKPDEIVPGVATYYASTFVQGGDYCPVLVKTREGRPIKIEGNDMSSLVPGGTSSRAQASVLGLYDTHRFRGPRKVEDGKYSATTWEELDSALKEKLAGAKGVRILSHTNMSPTLKKAIGEFSEKYGANYVQYDPISSAAILRANEESFGMKVVPGYDFSKAKVIASFDADFLGTWVSPTEFSKQYASGRKIQDTHHAEMSRHYQVESRMSLSGSNADHRVLVKPSELGVAIAYVYNAIVGGATPLANKVNAEAKKGLDQMVKDLKNASGQSLVVSASNNVQEQKMINAINLTLNNYGSTIDMANYSLQRQGDEGDLVKLVNEMKQGSVDVLINLGANPAYDSPLAADFVAGLEKVDMFVSTEALPSETTRTANYIAPDHHYLESWGDVQPRAGHMSLVQPTISPLFDTRQVGQSFLVWAGNDADYYDYLRANWEANSFGKQDQFSSFQYFWDSVVHDGVFSHDVAAEINLAMPSVDLSKVSTPGSGLELSLVEAVNVGSGDYATNPWLMEMPDPITRTVWGNYVSVPVSFDGDRSFVAFAGVKENGQMIGIKAGDQDIVAGAIKQFGQMPETMAIAVGYGRKHSGTTATGVGVNVFPLVSTKDGLFQYHVSNVELISEAGAIEENFANVQHHHTFGVKAVEESTGEVINADEAALVDDAFKWLAKGYQGSLTKRSIIRGGNLSELHDFVHELEHERAHHQKLNASTLYPFDEYSENLYSQGHHWGLHVDLNSCIGCGACTVACMAENNVPVVGKKEVSRHHEMTWLRIDRYYYGDVNNPSVVYQPMMCQHCDNAPCENVCPVNASNHSSEGLNQMAYNRCVGTRYCANNCPYKVRRFNWLDYTTADLFPVNEPYLNDNEEMPFESDNLTRMVLNPDVTVRSRGVIEKCSFCVQRIQEGKLKAKIEGRRLEDRDVKSACQTACPTGAITFGDRNNPEGDLAKKLESKLNYIVLEETNVQSSVFYSARITNKNNTQDS
jgi:molybdopterin-containing oxidoreductase family iron-sulfur binding subunit